jgi:RNA polymerase sigma-70 factor (sigma-E family)
MEGVGTDPAMAEARTATVPALVPTLTFEQLYRDRYAAMVRLAFLLVDRNDVAEELVQDAFVRVHAKWKRIDNPAAYLRTAVVNACRNEHRRRRAARRVGASEEGELYQGEGVEMFDALRVLAPERRAVLVLRYYEDLSTDEIASALGVAPGTVKSMTHRALAELREVLS